MSNQDHSSEASMKQDRFADSAGVPWEGRSFEANSWANDDGAADAHLIQTIENLHSGSGSVEQVVEAFRAARVLIPLLANLGESGQGAHGKTVDKSADLSIVTVETPDQQDGLPVFSSVQAMKKWNADARPVPVDAVKAALAAAQESNTRIVLDPGSPTEFVFRRPAIAAIAQSLPWIHPSRDPRVKEAFDAAVRGEELILSFEVLDIDEKSLLASAELQLELRLQDGLTREQLDPVLQRLAKALAESRDIAEYVDSLRVKLVS